MSKKQVYVAKGKAPWYSNDWECIDKVISMYRSDSGATVICDDNITDMSYMLYDCSNLTTIDLSNFDTSKVTNMMNMFRNCYNLTSLDLSKFNTSNVTNMEEMFFGCSGLTKLDLSTFDTSNVNNMSGMFDGCSKLTSLDLFSYFNTSKVTNMCSMFNSCFNLTTLDLSNFDTSKVTNMSYMFYNCPNLTTLDLSGFDTSKVDNMRYMFEACSSLTTLDVSKFNTSKVDDMGWMFTDCISLTTIKGVIDMKSCKHYKGMFVGCPRLTNVKIKNPPSDFESKTGLSSSQYTIVDDESNSLKRRTNMFNNFKNHDAPIADIYDKIMGGNNNPYKNNKTIIKVEYLDDDKDTKKEPEYIKATQEVVDTINSSKDEVDELSKSVAKLFTPSPKANKEKKEEVKPTTNEEKVKKTIDKEKLVGNKNNNLYHALTKFIYESDFIPAFIWFMENAYNNVSFDHQHKRRSYKIYKEIVKGGNLIGECLINDHNTDDEYCYFVLDGSNRSLNDFTYNRKKKAAKLLTNYIIASNTAPYVIALKTYIECYDGCSLYVPTGTSSVKKRSLSDMYVKTLEKVCFGKDF